MHVQAAKGQEPTWRAAVNPGRLATTAAVVLLLAGAAPARAGDAWQEAEALYARRAEGARGAIADRAQADALVESYRRALAERPGDLVCLGGLLRAMYFRATFCGDRGEAGEALLDEARRLGGAATDAMEEPLRGLPEEARLEGLKRIPGSAEVFFWSMANWGEWALIAGKVSAAASGAGGKVRQHGITVAALDPTVDEGGPDRALGRLHHQSPRIPFITGWVSKPLSLVHLRRSLAIGPGNRATWVFLAEAILDYEPGSRAEAVALLHRAVTEAPRPEHAVEDAHYAAYAHTVLATLR